MVALKLITLGEAGVGKTALTMRYANNTYGLHEMTIGVDFATKNMPDGGKVQIWDTAGQETFRSISRSYYRGADGALVIFALNNLQSFHKVQSWIEDFKGVNETALCVLVGTKCETKHVVMNDDIEKLLQKFDLKYFECSAKLNQNINAPFEFIYNTCKHRVSQEAQIKADFGNTIKQSRACC